MDRYRTRALVDRRYFEVFEEKLKGMGKGKVVRVAPVEAMTLGQRQEWGLEVVGKQAKLTDFL